MTMTYLIKGIVLGGNQSKNKKSTHLHNKDNHHRMYRSLLWISKESSLIKVRIPKFLKIPRPFNLNKMPPGEPETLGTPQQVYLIEIYIVSIFKII